MKLLPTPKRDAATALDSSVSNGAELAGAVIVFFLIGLGIDVLIGTAPIFMVGMLLFGVIGQFTKMYYSYSARMDALEEARAESVRGVRM